MPLRDQDRDPLNRDIDNEAQATRGRKPRRAGAARAAAAARAATPPTVQIDWNNIARRARQIPVPGDAISRPRRVADGAIGRASTVGAGGGRGGGRGGALTQRPASTSSTSTPTR